MENKIKEAIDEIQRGTAETIDIEAITKLIKILPKFPISFAFFTSISLLIFFRLFSKK